MATYMPYDVTQMDTIGFTSEQMRRTRELADELQRKPRKTANELVADVWTHGGKLFAHIDEALAQRDYTHMRDAIVHALKALQDLRLSSRDLAQTFDMERAAPPTVPLYQGRMSVPNLTEPPHTVRPHKGWRE